MQLPQRPDFLRDLDLMRRLDAYAIGNATWHTDGRVLGQHERAACQQLYANLSNFVERCLHPLMDRVTAREMQGFTMHDRHHGLKVAHLMWHILLPSRRETLTPGEVALLVISAHLHDLGMGLSQSERVERLSQTSDLWDRVDYDSEYAKALSHLSDLASRGSAGEAITQEAFYQVQQAQEALLCLDCRERHATRSRYRELLDLLADLHRADPIKIGDPLSALSFDGDSFEEKLIEICVSHNEDAHVLVDPDPTNFEQLRFPTRYPIGCCTADICLIAAALRLADILDFDRERTPAVLFHYLLPQSDDPRENISVREWSKHLAISNWQIEDERIVFRGRSPSAFIHHVIVEFCDTIEDEITRTKSMYPDKEWPFLLKPNVVAAIEATGYRYMPYRFSLDEQRVYDLLMGKNIYGNKLDAVRELIQNAVDACKLRDTLMQSHDQSVTPSTVGRIKIKYEESPNEGQSARLSVTDSGAGMDRYIIENFFLKVGRSYYNSSEFLQTRSLLRQRGLDFAPVAAFGIGFMAIFMLGDRVEVETALWSLVRKDGQRRLLRIDGVGRLIEVRETENNGPSRFFGTRISVQLTSRKTPAPTWDEVKEYIGSVCKNLEFSIILEHVTTKESESFELLPEGLKVPIPSHLSATAFQIPVDDPDLGLLGEIVFYRAPESKPAQALLAQETPLHLVERPTIGSRFGFGILLRGGFAVGSVPGLPSFVLAPDADARIEVSRSIQNPRSLPLTNLARSRLTEQKEIERSIFRTWLEALLINIKDIEKRPIGEPTMSKELLREAKWMESYSAFDLFRLARTAWPLHFKEPSSASELLPTWEKGEGPAIWVGDAHTTILPSVIFGMILPKVTSIVVAKDGNYYARPPGTGWRAVLQNWHTFVADNMTWPLFAEYISPVENVFFDCLGKNFLNKKFEDRFDGFDVSDVQLLRTLFEKLINARNIGRQAQLTRSEISLLSRVSEIAGELTIRRFGEQYTIRDLVKGRSQPATI
jgi:hypothetical protein